MNTVKDILRDADPLRHEPRPPDQERDRMRQAIVAAAARGAVQSPKRSRVPLALLTTAAVILLAAAAAGSRIWPHGSSTVYAAVRFEMRLAEDQQAAGLREVRVSASRTIYLHEEVVVSNDDVAGSQVVPGDGPSHFNIALRFTAAGAEKMRQATANHVGRPAAILIDGEVVMAPTLRSPIGDSSLISGDFSRAEAERIVNGIGVR